MKATDPKAIEHETEPLRNQIKELEGEVQLLSFREKELEVFLKTKEEELKAVRSRKLVLDKGTLTENSSLPALSPSKPPVSRNFAMTGKLSSFRKSFNIQEAI